MSDTLHLTILYEEGDDGWIVSSTPAVPGVLSQGRPLCRVIARSRRARVRYLSR